MMYQKAMCVCDQAIAKKILTTHDVAQIKKFGRQVSNYNENRWNGIRQIVVYEGLLAKFSQLKRSSESYRRQSSRRMCRQR